MLIQQKLCVRTHFLWRFQSFSTAAAMWFAESCSQFGFLLLRSFKTRPVVADAKTDAIADLQTPQFFHSLVLSTRRICVTASKFPPLIRLLFAMLFQGRSAATRKSPNGKAEAIACGCVFSVGHPHYLLACAQQCETGSSTGCCVESCGSSQSW
jgi:hypothetical protein